MKIRNGFVSNSSSSSFLILKRDLTEKQIEQIIGHHNEAYKYAMNCYEDEVWDIKDHGETITGDTWMDNFNMCKFLDRIGVDKANIEWDGENE